MVRDLLLSNYILTELDKQFSLVCQSFYCQKTDINFSEVKSRLNYDFCIDHKKGKELSELSA